MELKYSKDGSPTFIALATVSDEAIQQCIDIFNTLNPQVGVVGGGSFDPNIKNSLDLCVNPFYTKIGKEILYLKQQYAQLVDDDSIEHLNHCEQFNIQKYNKKTGGFPSWHSENTPQRSLTPDTVHLQCRHLAWMTYLNDVEEGGETQFIHYKLSIKPRKGLTLLWPAFFTHRHRGLPSNTTEKMIATGWLVTPNQELPPLGFFDRDEDLLDQYSKFNNI